MCVRFLVPFCLLGTYNNFKTCTESMENDMPIHFDYCTHKRAISKNWYEQKCLNGDDSVRYVFRTEGAIENITLKFTHGWCSFPIFTYRTPPYSPFFNLTVFCLQVDSNKEKKTKPAMGFIYLLTFISLALSTIFHRSSTMKNLHQKQIHKVSAVS